MNVLLFAKNYENYPLGYYHNDIINSFKKKTNTYVYGPGYIKYNSEDNLNDVIKKSNFTKDNIDLIVVNTSWDYERSETTVDPHTNIKFANIQNIPKLYFLNKEYKKMNLKLNYIKKSKFNYVCSVLKDCEKWANDCNAKFIHLPFGIDLNRFKDYHIEKKIDFAFSGSLNTNFTNERIKIKKLIFDKKYLTKKSNYGLSNILRKNFFNEEFKDYNIFWAEHGAKNFMYKSMLMKGIKYAKFLNSCKSFLNTPSAADIFSTRFFELMASKCLILCPQSDTYMGILKNGENCLMYNTDNLSFNLQLKKILSNDLLREEIINNAYNDVQDHSYDKRIDFLINKILN